MMLSVVGCALSFGSAHAAPECATLIDDWRSESDLAKKTVLYDALPMECKAQVTPGLAVKTSVSAPGVVVHQRSKGGVPDSLGGIDVGVTVGRVLSIGGGIRYERRFTKQNTLGGRLYANTGQIIESEDEGFYSGVAQVSFRRYTAGGAGYVNFELGVAVIRDREHGDPFDTDIIIPAETVFSPTVQLGLGGRLGALDVNAGVWLPFLGINLQVGVDF